MTHDNNRILIVDDNRAIHNDFSKILSTMAPPSDELDRLEQALFNPAAPVTPKTASSEIVFKLSSAFHGQQAFEMVKKAAEESQPYALIFMDMRMPPGWDGIETIEKIWTAFPDTEIVICSAYSDYSWDDVVARLGKSDHLLFLKKPFETFEVQQMALALTTKWNLNQQIKQHIGNLQTTIAQKTAELESQKAKAFNASKMATLGEMAGGIAHEINTPLATIQLFAEQFSKHAKENQFSNERLLKMSEGILSTVGRISNIIQGLRAFAREATNDPFATTPVTKIVESAMILCTTKFQCHGVDLRLAPIPADIAIECRATQISQVLLNLLNNAYDAIEPLPKKWIELDFKDLEDHVELSVTDAGNGIDSSFRDKIFQPFFTNKEIGKGSGLGLSISKGIVDSHRGQILLDLTHPNTRFVITLPKKQVE